MKPVAILFKKGGGEGWPIYLWGCIIYLNNVLILLLLWTNTDLAF